MKPTERPTGIIRTLPYFGAGEKDEAGAMREAYKRMTQSLKYLETHDDHPVYIALSQRPTKEVLHCYLLVGGKIRVRANIVDYANGNSLEFKCWDGTLRKAAWWAVLSAPVSWAPSTIFMRGFQGFRYTGDLW